MNPLRKLVRRVRGRDADLRRLVASSGLFDLAWYVREYPDVSGSGQEPLKHYLETGWHEGRRPGPGFDPAWYLSHYPDVAKADVNPLVHYLISGKREGRQPLPPKPILEIHRLDQVSVVAETGLRCAVVLHLHYADLAAELLDACLNIPDSSRILVSATSGEVEEAVRAWAAAHEGAEVVVRRAVNRGRNVCSFTTTFAKELRECDVFCHVHGKKSLYSGAEQRGWRQENLAHLLGSREHVGRILQLFKNRPELGVVGPLPSPQMPYWAFTWLSSLRAGVELSKLIDVPFGFEGYFDYPLGCMFWARSHALKQLIDGRISYERFPEESGQTDGTLAHAIERSIYFVARSNGYEWIEVDFADGSYKDGWSERNIYQYRDSHSYSAFLSAIDASETVCFDIFDTVITRFVPRPDDLFDMVEMKLDVESGRKSEFHRLRKDAESVVRLAKSSGDVGYEEIYADLSGRKEFSDLAHRARELEESFEIQVTVPRRTVVNGFNYAVSKGKRVILASDMYLHRSQVEKLLEKAGVRGHSKLYLSSETGMRKDDMSLWRHLLAEENAADPSFLHVGDSEHSDVQIPLGLGVRYFHVLSPRNLFDVTPLGYRLRRAGGARRNPLSMGPTIASLCNDPFEGRA